MTDQTIEPKQIGQINEGLFGDVDLYQAGLAGDIKSIYEWRVANGKNDGAFDEFYILAPSSQLGFKATTGHTFVPTKVGAEPMVLFKAHFHDVGYYLEMVTSKEMDINSALDNDQYAWFDMPKIPAKMVSSITKFFFAAHKKHGTEAIVLLTYNFEFAGTDNAEEGWGFSVPPQKNTAGHCNYDKAPIVAALVDTPHIRIVGTAHSHPNMGAFASDTDHKDQMGFNGLHITWGWQGASEIKFHAELVRGETFYTFKPEVVMDLTAQFQYKIKVGDEDIVIQPEQIVKEPVDYGITDDVVEDWCKTVEKEFAGPTHTNFHNGSSGGGGGSTSPKALPAKAGTTTADTYNQDFYPSEIPSAVIELSCKDDLLPDPAQNNIFCLISADAKICPGCTNAMEDFGAEFHDRRQCLFCGILFIYKDESVEDVDTARIDNGYTPFEDFLDTNLAYVVWNPKLHSYTSLEPGDSKKALSA